MPERREKRRRVSPRYEDNGLFKTPLISIQLDLIAQISRNRRGDVILKGLVTPDKCVDVVFAGRRLKSFEPLITNVRRTARPWVQQQGVDIAQMPPPRARVSVQLIGAWRTRFVHDKTGWQTRYHQFVVAQCVSNFETDAPITYGEPPVP